MTSDACERTPDDSTATKTGKRRARRLPLELPVLCRGVGREAYPGRTMNISRAGMLVGLTCAAFRSVTDPTSLPALISCVSSQFPDGLSVALAEGRVKTHAVVVRVVLDLDASYPLLIGCRFEPVLSREDCQVLGLPTDGDETGATSEAAEAPATAVPPAPAAPAGWWSPREPAAAAGPSRAPAGASACRLVAHVFPTTVPVGSTPFSGVVSEVGGEGAVVVFSAPSREPDPVGWAAGLGVDVRAVFLRDGEPLHDGRARVRRLEPAGPGEARAFLAFADVLPGHGGVPTF